MIEFRTHFPATSRQSSGARPLPPGFSLSGQLWRRAFDYRDAVYDDSSRRHFHASKTIAGMKGMPQNSSGS